MDALESHVRVEHLNRPAELDLSVDATLTFLFGSAANDAVTNGPVMVTLAHESARALMDRVRGELGLKPFPLTHSVHTTLPSSL